MINAIIERLDTLKANLTRPDTSIASPGTVENDVFIGSLQSMAQTAKSLCSNATTVIEGERSTINGGSIRGDPLTEDQFRNIRNWIPTAAKDLPNDTSGDAAAVIRTDEQSATIATAPSSCNTDFLGRAIDTVKKAIEHDHDGEYEKAYHLYYSTLELFTLPLSWENNTRSKRGCTQN
jgi:hypothetical protein